MRFLALNGGLFFCLCSIGGSLKPTSSITFSRKGLYKSILGLQGDVSVVTMQSRSYTSDVGSDSHSGGRRIIHNMTVKQLHGILTGDTAQSYQVVDVREDDEVRSVSLPFQDIHYLPLSQSKVWIPKIMNGELLDKNMPTLCLCHHGVRSKSMAEFLGILNRTQFIMQGI